VFVMENVKGMVNWSGGKAIEAILEEAGKPIQYNGQEYTYSVQQKVLNAADYGAPQFRERVFIIGNRVGKELNYPPPTHFAPSSQSSPVLFEEKRNPHNTVWDAIGHLPPAQPPSEAAKRVSKSIKGRILKHGY
jgi:DNA (cytosine-5)-methyltransferase 1